MGTPLNFNSRLRFFRKWPAVSARQKHSFVLLYDRRLEKICPAFMRRFPLRLGLNAGEGLKTFRQAEKVLARLLRLTGGLAKEDVRIVALGGGSVGDFAGLCASLLRRGTPMIQIPSTWLAAVDSAHGGKTALNLAGAKNQVGSYWPAAEVWLIHPLLVAQPEERRRDVLGEVYKTALIGGGSLYRRIAKKKARNSESAEDLWSLLPELIRTKMKIVQRDPFEKKGFRHVLNLGHTVGHVLESRNRLSHGTAVLYGLAVAVEWRRHELRLRGQFKDPAWINEMRAWPEWPSATAVARELRRVRNWQQNLKTDKKAIAGKSVRYVMPLAPGRIDVRRIPVSDLVAEIDRQSHD